MTRVLPRHTDEMPQLPADVQRQLEMANSQLALYARDLKRIVDAEREKASALEQANARLQLLDRLKTDFLSFISHDPLISQSEEEPTKPMSSPSTGWREP